SNIGSGGDRSEKVKLSAWSRWRIPQLAQSEEKNKITNEVIKPMALNGLRTICLAYLDYLYELVGLISPNCKSISPNEEPDWDSEIDMACLTAVEVEDPVK